MKPLHDGHSEVMNKLLILAGCVAGVTASAVTGALAVDMMYAVLEKVPVLLSDQPHVVETECVALSCGGVNYNYTWAD